MDVVLGEWEVESRGDGNGVSGGITIDIMKCLVISHGRATTWERIMEGTKGEITTCTGLFICSVWV